MASAGPYTKIVSSPGVALCPYNLLYRRRVSDQPPLDLQVCDGRVYCNSCKCFHEEMDVYPAPTEKGPCYPGGTEDNTSIRWWRCAKCSLNTVGAFGQCYLPKCGAIHQPPKPSTK